MNARNNLNLIMYGIARRIHEIEQETLKISGARCTWLGELESDRLAKRIFRLGQKYDQWVARRREWEKTHLEVA